MPGEGGQELWFTELHMDLFRIVHEHIELGIGTGIEVVLFNVIIAQADFLVDVQNEILRSIRSDWRSVGFVYLCSLINNCQRCAELWGNAIKSSKSPRSPLSEALAANLHLGYVADGFVNLGFAAMQLSSHRVLALLEVPIAALFRKGARHSPEAMAALVDQRLSIITDGVASSHAPRAAAICLEQLMCSDGVMLFLSDLHDRAHFTPETPPTLAADLDAFDGLMARHCGASTTYANNHGCRRAAAVATRVGDVAHVHASYAVEDGTVTIVDQVAAVHAHTSMLAVLFQRQPLQSCRVECGVSTIADCRQEAVVCRGFRRLMRVDHRARNHSSFKA